MVIPRESIIELAKRIKYQKLENARVIAYEGQAAKNLYYVLSGKISCVKKFDLSDGDLYKVVNTLNKGQHTDPDEVEKRLKRSYLMYSKGVTEVLVLSAVDLEVLRYNSYHLPIDFISSLNLFKSYPIKTLTNSTENIFYQYFGPNEIISQDSENSPWIYVIISGHVKVVKKMKLINSSQSNPERSISIIEEAESIRETNSSLSEYPNEDNNHTKQFQISDTFISTREIKLERDITLPQIDYSSDRIINRQSNVYLSASIRRETPSQSGFIKEYLDDNTQFVKSEYELLYNKKQKDDKKKLQRTISIKSAQNRRPNLKPIVNYRLAYVVVDKIQKGDIFGLYPLIGDEKTKIQNLSKKNFNFNQTKSADDRKNVILISEGAELVMINKVSFYQYADVLTLCKIEQLEKSDGKYISEQEARDQFHKLDKWKEYKKKLFKSLANIYN